MNLWLLVGMVLVAGLIEELVNTWHLKSVARSRAVQSGVSSFVYTTVWYFVLSNIIKHLDNHAWMLLVSAYAVGNAIGAWTIVKLYHFKDRCGDD